jgi:hypothetical protein
MISGRRGFKKAHPVNLATKPKDQHESLKVRMYRPDQEVIDRLQNTQA